MDIEFIVEIVMLFGVYIVVGMIISYIVNDISYLAYDYFWLTTILYPIILPILLYFELKRFVKELRKNIKEIITIVLPIVSILISFCSLTVFSGRLEGLENTVSENIEK